MLDILLVVSLSDTDALFLFWLAACEIILSQNSIDKPFLNTQ